MSLIRMSSHALPLWLREKEEETFVCTACKHEFKQEVLFVREDGEVRPFRVKGYELDEIFCPECGQRVEVLGLEDANAHKDDLVEDWIEHYSHARIETGVCRKSLYPEYDDEKGGLEKRISEMDHERLMAYLLASPRPRKLGKKITWICFKISGIPLNLYPTEAPSELLSPEGRMRIFDCARFGRDWASWRFCSKVTMQGSLVWKKQEWIECIIPFDVLPKADIDRLMRAVHYHFGRIKLLQGAEIGKWSDLLLNLEDAEVPPSISGIDNETQVAAFSDDRYRPEMLGLKMSIFPRNETWRDTAGDGGIDEKWYIQSHIDTPPFEDRVRMVQRR